MKPHQSNARPATTYRGARRAAAREQKLMWSQLHKGTVERLATKEKAGSLHQGGALFIHVEP